MSKRPLPSALLLAAMACDRRSTSAPDPVVVLPEPVGQLREPAPTSPPLAPVGARALARSEPALTDLAPLADSPETHAPAPVCTPDQRRACTFQGKKGVEECERDGQWSGCGLVAQCSPGQRRSCGEGGEPVLAIAGKCILSEHRWVFHGCATPLVLSFDDAPVAFTDAPGAFDLRAAGSPLVSSRWVSPATPWLALDLDRSGAIEDARELFGSASVLPSGARAQHGFEALAAHDDDHDGWLTPRDAVWPHLVLWSDANQDRRSSPDELAPLASRRITALAVSFRDEPRCERGACEVERATFRFRDAQGREREGTVIDVHLAAR